MAHCVTARWRNFSHYCRPLRQYDIWFTCSDNREALTPRRQHTVYRNKRLEFTTEQVGRLRYVTVVDGGLKRFPSVAWFAHPWSILCTLGIFLKIVYMYIRVFLPAANFFYTTTLNCTQFIHWVGTQTGTVLKKALLNIVSNVQYWGKNWPYWLYIGPHFVSRCATVPC